MELVRDSITLQELKKMFEKMFDNLVKAVVDVEKEIMIVDAKMHSDQESVFLEEEESEQRDLWGINLYPHEYGNPDWIVFDSMINMRPSWGNKSRGVDDIKIQEKIRSIVNKLVKA